MDIGNRYTWTSVFLVNTRDCHMLFSSRKISRSRKVGCSAETCFEELNVVPIESSELVERSDESIKGSFITIPEHEKIRT